MDFLDMNVPAEDAPVEEPKKEPKPNALSKVVEGPDFLMKAAAEVGIVIPAEKAAVLRQFLKASKYGHQASLAMKCRGAKKCAFIDMCPLHKIGADLPLNKQCPVESSLINQWTSQFIESMELDPDDPSNAVEMHMVYELAGLELIRRRAAHSLSNAPELINREIVGYSPQGDPIWDDKPSQALLILERQSKIVNKLREALLATPKSQAQAGQASRDLSTRTSNIMEKARKLQELRQQGGSVQDADFKIVDDEKPNIEQEQNKGSVSEDKPKNSTEDSDPSTP